MTRYQAVLFDLGGVVVSWEPARAYASVLAPELVADFMARIDFEAWNRSLDAGRAVTEGEQELIARHPQDADAVLAYRRHFVATLTGLVPGTGAVIAELAASGLRLAALTNWSAETFPVARERFGLLRRFEGVLVSGEERLAKPDPRIFTLALDRFGFSAATTVFVDDSPVNVAAASAVGLTAFAFTDAEQLHADLVGLGLLAPRSPVEEPVFHLTERRHWEQARRECHYPWSSRDLGYEAEGFVHASFATQLGPTRVRFFGDLADDDLVVLELDPGRLSSPLVVEDLGAGPFPHLYGPLDPAEVAAVHAFPLGQVAPGAES